MSRVVVVGSLNVDHILQVGRFALPGETMHASNYAVGPGGKGLNQCVAVRRLMNPSIPVIMHGRIGLDAGGKMIERVIQSEKIEDGLTRVEGAMTGAAFVTVNGEGQNHIVLYGGTNMSFTVDQLDGSLLQDAAAVVLQLEIPMATVKEVASMAMSSGTKVILNPAPCQPLPSGLLTCVDYLIVNEVEAQQLAEDHQGKMSCWARATKLLDAGVKQAVIVTQGKGPTVAVFREGKSQRVSEIKPPVVAQPVDTTGAGDAFIGAFTAIMVETKFTTSIEQAVAFANAAGALTVTRPGAALSIPCRSELSG